LTASTHRARRTLLAAVVLTAALALAACGTKQDVIGAGAPRPFSLMLDFFPNADHAAIYAAISRGDFTAAGLNVRPEVPADPSQPLKLLAAGKVDMAISYEPELLLARSAGLKLVSVGALVQRPLTSLIALPSSHVTSVAALRGKTVGTAGIDYQSVMLSTMLHNSSVAPASVKQVNVGFNLVPAMLSGQVAATLGGFWNYEAIQLRQMRRNPLVIPVDQAGVPTYNELILVVRQGEAQTDGESIRAFLHALTLGQQAVKANPANAAHLVVAANPSLDPKLQLASIQATLAADYPANTRQPYGYQNPTAWAAFSTWMFRKGLLSYNPNLGAPPFTNEFLPGQGI
jgi:putative hydroxymethylpyrimidine transport system substrate-binding protein